MKPLILILLLSFLVTRSTPGRAAEVETITVYGNRESDSSEEKREFESLTVPIEVRGGESLGDKLRVIPSIDVRESGGEGATPNLFIRGQDPKQTRFFLEGFPLADAEFNGGNINLIPISSLGRASVYPEGIPVSLADDGLGGAINFNLQRPVDAAPVVAARFGSYQYLNGNGSLALKSYSSTLDLDFTQSVEDYVYYDDNGTPYNSSDDQFVTRTGNKFQRALVLPRFEKKLGPGARLRAFSLNAYSMTQVPGATDLPSNGSLTQYFQLTGIKYETRIAPWLNVRTGIFSRLDFQDLNTPAGEANLRSSRSGAVTLGMRSRWQSQWSKRLESELNFGGGWQKYNYTIQDNPSLSNQRFELPFGATLKFDYGKLILKPGLGGHFYRYSSTQTAAFTGNDFALVSPRLATSFNLNQEIELRLAGGSFYRAPSMYELYGTPGGLNANPALNYERSYRGSVGATIKLNRPLPLVRSVKSTYDFFVSRNSNLITLIQNSPQSSVATNIGESWIQGHELSGEVLFEANLKLQIGITFLRATNITPVDYQLGNVLPGRPPYRGTASFGYESEHFGLGYNLAVTGPTFWDVANIKQMGSVWDHGLYGFWDTRRFGVLTVEARNIGDVITAYSYYGDESVLDNTTAFYGYPAPGRRFYLSWRYFL